MKHLHETNHWIKTHGDLALDMVRIYLGIGLMVKAVYFMTHSEYLLQLMPVSGSALPVEVMPQEHLKTGFQRSSAPHRCPTLRRHDSLPSVFASAQ